MATYSAAIPILRPPTAPPSTNTSPTSTSAQLPLSPGKRFKEDSKKLCRNVLIYGQCRFQDKGCVYGHDLNEPGPSAPTTPTLLTASSTPFSVAGAANAAVFVPTFGGGPPSAGPATVSAPPSAGGGMGVGAQEFVPRRVETPALSDDQAFYSPTPPPGTNGAPKPMTEAGQAETRGGELAEYYDQAMDLNGEYAMHQQQLEMHHQQQLQQEQQMRHPDQQAHYDYNPANPSSGGSTYYASQPFSRQPLQYHHYHPAPTHSLAPAQSFFLPPSLHVSLTAKSEATHATPAVDMKLPEEVGGYHGLMPLDKSGEREAGGWAGYRSWVYKAWKGDGRAYALRRIEGFRLQHEQAIAVVEKWSRVRHPGLVSVREAFTTRAFGDHSIIFVYDFHACSTTLYEAHLSPLSALPPNPWSHPSHLQHTHAPFRSRHPTQLGVASTAGAGAGIAERVLWSYIVQIGSVIKAVHNAGLAVRNLEVNRILVTGTNRVRLGGCGVLDVLGWDGGGHAGYQDDLLAFGKLIIALACGSTSSVHNLPKSVDHISRVYSADLKNVVLYLLSKPGPRKTVEEVLTLMGGRVLDELNAAFSAEDTLEAELMRELENGRLVRLLTKFGFINERPEFDHDPRWAETGDRYIIKLFRDFVFHQVDENGRPVTDLSHVLTTLNKLDAGVDEKIMLVSRDEQSCLIVSYREVKNCIETAFLDLSR